MIFIFNCYLESTFNQRIILSLAKDLYKAGISKCKLSRFLKYEVVTVVFAILNPSINYSCIYGFSKSLILPHFKSILVRRCLQLVEGFFLSGTQVRFYFDTRIN